MSPTLALACELIARASVTPGDAGCQTLLADRLASLGFAIEALPFGPVHNLWARRGHQAPLLVFAGHTDVVPPGPPTDWTSPPFVPTSRAGRLYGRGAADMKGSLAAMVTACERFFSVHAQPRGSIAFLLTSDEEGPSVDGTVKVMAHLHARGERIDYCLVGEPTSAERLGDTVKNGRRGSLSGTLTVLGIQGHVAYPQHADNPIHRVAPALTELCAAHWDEGNAHFPPTSFQVSNIHAGTGVGNVIPGQLTLDFNFRYCTASRPDDLRQRVHATLDRHGLQYRLHWTHHGAPYLTPPGMLTAAITAAIGQVTGIEAALSTSGGTSDGRFIAPSGAEVVEFGPLNASIHRVDECIAIDDLERLSRIYEAVLDKFLA